MGVTVDVQGRRPLWAPIVDTRQPLTVLPARIVMPSPLVQRRRPRRPD